MVELDVVQDVAVDDEQVAPAVIVKVEKARAERAIQNIGLTDARRNRVIGESAVAIIAIHAVQFEIQVAHEEIEQAIVHHVGGIGAHARFGAAVFAEARAGFVGRVAKRAVAVVEIQKIPLRVVGDENVRPSVAIQVRQHHAQAFAVGVRQAGFFSDVGERAVAVIVIQLRGRARESYPGWQ